MASIRAYLSESINGITISGGTDLDPSRIVTTGGGIYTLGGEIYTAGGNIFSDGGDIRSLGGNISTTTGNITSTDGVISTTNGSVRSVNSSVTAGTTVTAGTAMIAGTTMTAGGNISGANFITNGYAAIFKQVFSRSASTTSTTFSNWFQPENKECGRIIYTDNTIIGCYNYYALDAVTTISFDFGATGYLNVSGGKVLQIKAKTSGVTMQYYAIRFS
jgi:hypothetical protein